MDFYDLRFNPISSSIFNCNLKNDELKIYAHPNELLIDHIQKTKYVFNNLKDDNVLLNFYNYFINEGYLSLSFEEFSEILTDFIFYHDIGKLSLSFQIKRLNKTNPIVKNEQLKFLSNYNLNRLDYFEENHSFSGSLLFLSKYKTIFEKNSLFILLLAYSIFGHHSSLKDVYANSEFTYNFSNKDINTISLLLLFLDIANINQIEHCEFDQRFFQSMQNLITDNKTPDDSVFSFFYNYIYSLLISSDVLASREYNRSIDNVEKINFNNRITEDLKLKMKKSFFNVEYNQNILNKSHLKDLTEVDDINVLRQNMLLESSYNLKKHVNSNKIFSLNLPTGGGKTNTSMKLALDLLESTTANRIIYAMPFINIIEQNYDIICDNFNLIEEESEIRKIYSATETIFNDKSDEFKSKIILQDSFFNYPVICTTFSTFFDSILRVRKGYKFKVSALTNSIVILDEVQSLPLRNWTSLYYLINEISEKYNIYFIVMSATLPKFNELRLDSENNMDNYNEISLISRPENYFDHYLFNRTKINGKIKEFYVQNEDEIQEYLFNIIFSNFNEGYNKGLIVLNTIKSSKLIYDLLKDNNDFEIDLLNSSLLYNVKQRIIYKINNMNNDSSKKYILISTQSIEAGVDVSFDFVIRDFAILDSIEQVRGRCNRSRELNKDDPYKKGNIYLINLKDKKKYIHEYIYDDNEINSRILETRNLFDKCEEYKYKDILKYYSSVSNDINNLEDIKEENFNFNDRNNIYFWNNLEYLKLQSHEGIHIIYNDLNQYSIFIPINMNILHESTEFIDFENISEGDLINIYKNNPKNFVFTLKELEFLKIIEETTDYSFINDDCIDGVELIEYYKEIINEYSQDINSLKILQKEFSSILYKFMVNLNINNYEIDEKIRIEFEKIGYFYIMDKKYIGDDEDKIYSVENGLNQIPKIVEIL